MIEFTATDAFLLALASFMSSILAWVRAVRSDKTSTRLEEEKIDVLKQIGGLYRLHEESEGGKSPELAALAGRLATQVLSLPDQPNDRALREAILWDTEDQRRLEELAAADGNDLATVAADAVRALTFVRETVSRVQSVNPGLGYDYNLFPSEKWYGNLQEARRTLGYLAEGSTSSTKRANINVNLTGDRFYIWNLGDQTVYNVNFEVVTEEGQPSPLVANDVSRKLPIDELEPGDSCPLMASLTLRCSPPFTVVVSWDDDPTRSGQRQTKRKTLYGT